MRNRSWLRLVAVAMLVAIPLSMLLAEVLRFGVNVPYADQWNFAYLLEQSERGQMDPADLWSQHNEHRILFPRLLMFFLAKISGWNIRLELLVNVLLATAVLVLILTLLRRAASEFDSRLFLPLAAAAAWLIFSPVQWENWLWGWQIQWFSNILSVVAAAAALSLAPERRALLGVVVAIVAATVGTFSLSMGVLIWVACIPIFALRPAVRKYIWLWLAAAIVVDGLFFLGYMKPAGHPSLSTFLDKPMDFAKYVAIYLGGSVTTTPQSSGILGLILIIAFAAALLRLTLRRKQAPPVAGAWAAIGLYALASALLTGLGRVGFGIAQATESRYTTIAILFLVAVATTLLLAFRPRLPAFRSGLVAVGLLWLSVALVLSYRDGIAAMRERRELMVQTQACLIEATSRDEPCLTITFPPSGAFAWDRSRFLIRKRWAGLAFKSDEYSPRLLAKRATLTLPRPAPLSLGRRHPSLGTVC